MADLVSQGDPIDRSGTITAGGTAQALLTADESRTSFFLQNNSAGELRVRFTRAGTAATSTTGINITAGSTLALEPSDRFLKLAASIWGATTGQAFVATEG